MSKVKNIIERLRAEAEHSTWFSCSTIDVNNILDEIERAVNRETSKAYSDGNIQGYEQGFKDGKRKGSVMHDDGSVTWGDYTGDVEGLK